MTLEEAKSECRRWLAHLQRQRENTKTLQKAAALARSGDKQGAMRLKHQVDNSPTVYDGALLEQAVKKLLKEQTK